ncbi:eEF1A lysine and N-terminal methyltransferase homolog [Drosophila grimshawi]|uniref:eEF1A lysine and N-terminal methyltransferase homolog n=1 Tax=Drosophila grimshawi TaxID=7222 RepID=B4JAI9_DROGR|nr:eEF1A lysine and N-terminal methyltransferase homolog [Drosophila grimshawi]EDW02775.1 GH10876 [Drosophila grimshawi]
MNLLPRTREEFGQADYWNEFFKKRGEKAFEWYGEYLELCDQIHKYIKPAEKILMLGCGNSKLSMDMYDKGFRDITNIDISSVAVKKMIEINARTRPDMKFIQMDATAMSFQDESFSVALDKGTLDAIFVNDDEDTKATVELYFTEILRTMRNGGRYVGISMLQEHIINYLLEFLPRHNCMLRIVHCLDVERANKERSEDALTLPVFVIIATKFKNLPMPIFEFGVGNDKMQRFSCATELVNAVASVQKAALVCNGLARSSIVGHNEVTMDLHRAAEPTPRYTVHILDQPAARGLGKYAAFIVPQGREIEWLFATPAGRRKLQASAKYQRLAVVTLHRDQVYSTLDEVKSELGYSITNLAPAGLKEKIPYLSLGSEVGKRETLISGCSQISGDFRIEEVEIADKTLRRLIFLSNQFVVQSEALVKTVKIKAKKDRKKIDFGYLACQHHRFMSVGVQLAATMQSLKKDVYNDVLVIGLGGGGLCSFLHAAFPQARVTAVEIDPIMLEVAEQYFDLKQDDRLHVVIDDGLAFVERCRNEDIQFGAVLFDVDSKDLTLGMSCPPRSFLANNILLHIKEIIGPKGLFMLNLVCRDETLRAEAINNLQQVFSSVCSYKLDEDINEVVYCTNAEYKTVEQWKKQLGTAGRCMNSAVRDQKLANKDSVDVADFLSELKI